MRWFLALILVLSASSVSGRGLDVRGCSKAERKEVKTAIRWLIDNLAELDSRMGSSTLLNWPPNVRARFRKRLVQSDFKVSCWPAAKCEKHAAEGQKNSAVGYPIFHRSRITLCPDKLPDVGAFAAVIAHELGHLVYVNGDRKTCAERCSNPRLSHSLALAAHRTWNGTEFNGLTCLTECVSEDEHTDIESVESPKVLPKALPR